MMLKYLKAKQHRPVVAKLPPVCAATSVVFTLLLRARLSMCVCVVRCQATTHNGTQNTSLFHAELAVLK